MNEKFIKIINPDASNYLEALGFNYISMEVINNKQTYVYENTDAIRKVLEKCDKKYIFSDSKLSF